MAVPNIFATATTTIPLSQLDANFATAITLGNTAIYLGNTTTSIGNLTLTNATISSVSTAVTVAQGGTGLTSGTSGGVPYFSATTTMASSAALAANALVIGGGVGAAPATTTTGTGVLTALGVNTGTAGAFVVNGGALGTPSSGTVTNLTGTASININGTVGATTPNTGAFTTLSATGAATLNNGATISATSGALGIKLIGRAADNVSNLLFYKNDGTTLVGDITNTNSAINVEVGSVVGSFTSTGLAVTGASSYTGAETILNATAIPAGGTAGSGYKFSSTSNFGVFFGSGAPTLSAAKGSLYLRSDGTTTNDRMYVNTNGSTTWTAVTTAA